MGEGMKRFFINGALFEAGWFACVTAAASGAPLLGLLVAILVVLLHLVSVPSPGRELRLILLAVVMGVMFDSLLVASGWIRYPNGILVPGTAPYWILAMWAMFATTLNVSLGWLKGRPLLAVVMGGVFGPMSYLAGEGLGGLEFIDRTASLVALSIGWAISMPLLAAAAERFNGVAKPRWQPLTRGIVQGEG
jgi:hypothetical protein